MMNNWQALMTIFFKHIRNRKPARNSRRQLIIRIVREDLKNKGLTENTSGRFTSAMVTVRDTGEPLQRTLIEI